MVFRFASFLTDRLRGISRRRPGVSSYLDETHVRIAGLWCFRYRAIDRDGQLVDSMHSERCGKHSAPRFLHRVVDFPVRNPLLMTADDDPA